LLLPRKLRKLLSSWQIRERKMPKRLKRNKRKRLRNRKKNYKNKGLKSRKKLKDNRK